jgi:hypothetical protein
MMRLILVFAFVLFSISAGADEVRTYKKLNSSQAEVVIQTVEQDSTQAAAYVDGLENEQFVNDLLKDKNSLLYKLKHDIEIENCDHASTTESSWIPGCGEVTLTARVRTSFGRGGWDAGGAAYTFFIGFTEEGTGHFFDVSHMVTISESVLAQTNSAGDYSGKIIKTLNFGKITRIDEHQPFTK